MILPPPSEFVRVLPAPDALHVILKNTHFKKELLNESAELRFVYRGAEVIIVFHFPEPWYDFSETLTFHSEMDWLHAEKIVVTLRIADSVIADELTTRDFILSVQESNALRTHLLARDV
jgi:hypothetical protein